jgi:putative heme-binding domain-containing protein
LQALCTLDGFGAVTPEVLAKAFHDKHPAVRENAIRITEPMLGKSAQVGEALLQLVDDPETRVRYQLAFSLGEWKSEKAGEALGRLALKENEDGDIQTALLSSARPHVDAMLKGILSGLPERPPSSDLMEQLTKLAVIEENQSSITRVLSAMEKENANTAATWQLATLLGFLEGLDRKGITWSDYSSKANSETQPAVKAVEANFKQIPQIVADAKIPLADRQMAVRLLRRGVVNADEAVAALGKLLGPDVEADLQKTALETLEHSSSIRVGEVLLTRWKDYSPEIHTTVMNMMFSRPNRTKALMQALEAGTIPPSQVAIVHRQQLLNHSDAEIRERAKKLFAASNADRQKVVVAYQDVLQLKGNPEHGAEVFRANCALCHNLKGEGNAVGPDLSTVGDKPASELITSILDPNRTIEATYVSYNVVMKDGRELAGVIAAETPNSITLRMLGSPEQVILRKDLEKLTSNSLSLMPEGFESVIKQQDMADLIAYITSATPLKAAK